MKRWQKVLLTLLVTFCWIAGLSAYGIRFMGEASQTVNKISKTLIEYPPNVLRE